MNVFHSEEGFERPRSHPYVGTRPGHAGFVDFKLEPERIPQALEDFVALSHEPSIQTFYGLLRWINGPDSILESCDCALLGPGPHEFDYSTEPICVHGRLMIMYRDLSANCDDRIDDLYHSFYRELVAIDPELSPEHGAIGLALSRSIYRDLSPAQPDENNELWVMDSDPGLGHQLMLLFRAFGRTPNEAFQRLDRIFRNLEAACLATSMSLRLVS